VISQSFAPFFLLSWQACAGFALLGLLLGSFLNVLILRLPIMMNRAWAQEIQAFMAEPQNQEIGTGHRHAQDKFNLFVPRSHCPQCNTTIPAIYLVPVMSWIILRGRCVQCRSPISARYALIELLTAGMSLAVMLHWGVSLTAGAALILICSLIALTFIDIDTLLLPDSLTQPLLWSGLIVNFYGLFVSFTEAFWGAVWGYLCLWSLYWIFRTATGREGIGEGDFKLLGALGAWLGWQALPGILLIASFTGAGYGLLAILVAGHTRHTPIPFGPFLALGGLMMLFFPFHLESI
jgi:leader peptidase (prepilin peptidase) / N-methyltransferase